MRDGWNLTGDSFVQDDDGYFHFAARSDDMIISSGYNIAGPEVEAALLSHADVVECAVIGVPDEARGQIVQAHVVLADGVEPSRRRSRALQEHVKAAIAPYKYPRSIVFTDALPKTQTGKIQRFRLRQPHVNRVLRVPMPSGFGDERVAAVRALPIVDQGARDEAAQRVGRQAHSLGQSRAFTRRGVGRS